MQNYHKFDVILTWNSTLINTLDNAYFLPFGHTWFSSNQYNTNHSHKFGVSHLCGTLRKTVGHEIRHEILNRKSEIIIPTNFYLSTGNRHNIELARIEKEQIFASYEYGIAIENISTEGYFTEKILDCFLLKTIPIYWGCKNIGNFFNESGIFSFETSTHCIEICNSLTPQEYVKKLPYINENYELAKSYVCYEKTIANKIIEIFT
jgi:hypothetical protein